MAFSYHTRIYKRITKKTKSTGVTRRSSLSLITETHYAARSLMISGTSDAGTS